MCIYKVFMRIDFFKTHPHLLFHVAQLALLYTCSICCHMSRHSSIENTCSSWDAVGFCSTSTDCRCKDIHHSKWTCFCPCSALSRRSKCVSLCCMLCSSSTKCSCRSSSAVLIYCSISACFCHTWQAKEHHR